MKTEAQLLAEIERRDAAARPYNDHISELRARNIDYYLRRPDGEEVEGRSQVTSSAVAETVDSAHAQIIDFFDANDRAVEFEGATEESSQHAEKANQLFEHIYYTLNEGTIINDTMIKSGLMAKVGIAKVYWDKSEAPKEVRLKGLTEVEYQSLALDDTFYASETNEYEDVATDPVTGEQVQQKLYDVVGIESKPKNQVKIDCVAPEDVIVGEDATSPDIGEVRYLAHMTQTTRAALIAQGYDADKVSTIGLHDSEAYSRPEKSARRFDESDPEHDDSQITLEEVYIVYDFDDDGREETRKVCKVGKVVLANEMVSYIPFASWTPKPMPHEFFGECPADEAIEFQDQETTLKRQMNDGIYLQNSPRMYTSERGVNIDDLMTIRPGGIVRGETPALQPQPLIAHPTFDVGSMLSAIEMTKAEREQRTSITRHNQGLDGDTLSKTAAGTSMLMTQSMMRIKQMARNFANLGMRRIARLSMKVLSDNQPDAMTIIKGGKPVQIDPQVWNSDYNLSCTVSLGSGSRQEQLIGLQMIGAMQKEALAGGMGGTLVTESNLFESAKELVRINGYKNAEKFFMNPAQAPPKPPPPPPLELTLLDKQLQHDAQKKQAELALQAQENQAKQAVEMRKIQSSEQVAHLKAETDLIKASAQYSLDSATLTHQIDGDVLTRNAESSTADAASKGKQAETNAIMQLLAQIQQQNAQLLTAITAPKRVHRDEAGRAIGIETVTQ